MPKPYKPVSTRPLPPDAEIVDHDGKPHVRVKERGRSVLYRLSKDGPKYLRPSKRWYFDLPRRGRHGRRVKGFADLKATEQLAADTERKASRVRAGFTDPAEEHARRPLADHLKDYAAALEAKGNTAEHCQLTTGRIAALLSGCGFVFPLDADAGQSGRLVERPSPRRRAVELPAGDSFTPAETAKLLGVSGAAVRSAVKRLELIRDRQRQGPHVPPCDGRSPHAAKGEGVRAGNREPLRSGRARVLPLAREGEADRLEPARNPVARERRRGPAPHPAGTDGR